MSKGFASNYRIVIIAFAVLASFAGVGTRLVFLHVVNREQLVRTVDKARRQIIEENACRGDILDARNDILATSRSMIQLGVDPQMLRKEEQAKWPALAQLLGLSLPELKTTLTTKTRPAGLPETTEDDTKIGWAKLKDEISEPLYDQVQALAIKGVYGIRNYRRTYPHNQLAAHVIGYLNKEQVPTSGVERYADFYLRGQNGWRESEKDGHQHELAQFRTRDVPATHGYSVKLSIDSVVQTWVEEELAEIGRKFSPEHASIIVSDAQTGFILAMSNYPTFNLNEFGAAPMEAQKNFAIASQIDPGSTFKVVAVSGVLNEGLVTLDDRVNCALEYVDYNGRHLHLMREDNDVPMDHPLSVAEIVCHSSNRGAAQLAMKLGDRGFYNYARAFGFGQKSGFPFGGEIEGDLNPPEKWSGIDITRMPAGYSVSATPIQVHYAMATIASGGELLKPQLIRAIRDATGDSAGQFGTIVRRRVITHQTAEHMATALQGVVLEGTGKNAAIPGYQVAGKTGTAQILINGHYSEDHHVTSFVGFLPASHPQVVISVVVDDPKVPRAHAWGSFVAAPSFKAVAEHLIPYLPINKPESEPAEAILAMGGQRL